MKWQKQLVLTYFENDTCNHDQILYGDWDYRDTQAFKNLSGLVTRQRINTSFSEKAYFDLFVKLFIQSEPNVTLCYMSQRPILATKSMINKIKKLYQLY